MDNNTKPDKFYLDDLIETITFQNHKWNLYDKNFKALVTSFDDARSFILEPYSWKIDYFNVSYRKGSASADVDKAISGERPCFLCDDNRPKEQLSFDWGEYELLLNPYPVSLPHLTIPSRSHKPQLMTPDTIRDMARLTRILPDCAIFYNGPRCGASAPDHFHFQAVEKKIAGNMSVRSEIKVPIPLAREGKSTLCISHKNLSPFTYLHIISKKDAELIPLFKKAWAALPPADPEPMVNIIAWKSKLGTEVVIIPRRAHRPECYGEEESQMLISPACVELMGWFPISRVEDFNALTEEKVEKIYDDVCLTMEQTEEIIQKINPCLVLE